MAQQLSSRLAQVEVQPRIVSFREFIVSEFVPPALREYFRRILCLITTVKYTFITFGLLIIPGWLLTVGIWKYASCHFSDGHSGLPLMLILFGVAVFFMTLYVPCYQIGKQRAKRAQENGEEDSDNDDEDDNDNEEVDESEIRKRMPCCTIRLSSVAYFFLITYCPVLTYTVFSSFSERHSCHPLIYWSAVTVCLLYLLVVTLFLSVCLFIPCYLSRKREDRELVEV